MQSHHFCSIILPRILREIVKCGSAHQKSRALETLIQSEQLRGLRMGLSQASFLSPSLVGKKRRRG